MPEIDAGYRDAAVTHEGKRLQEGAVAAEREKEVGIGGQVFGGRKIFGIAEHSGTFFAEQVLDRLDAVVPVSLI